MGANGRSHQTSTRILADRPKDVTPSDVERCLVVQRDSEHVQYEYGCASGGVGLWDARTDALVVRRAGCRIAIEIQINRNSDSKNIISHQHPSIESNRTKGAAAAFVVSKNSSHVALRQARC